MFNFKKTFLLFLFLGISSPVYAMDYIKRLVKLIFPHLVYDKLSKYHYRRPNLFPLKIEAVKNCDTTNVKNLLNDNDRDINNCDENGKSLLYYAFEPLLQKNPEECNSKIIKKLLTHGAHANIIIGKNKETYKECDVTDEYEIDETPLTLSLKYFKHNSDLIDSLVKAQADVNINASTDYFTYTSPNYRYNKNNKAPLSVIINDILQEKNELKQKSNYNILEILLKYNASPNILISQKNSLFMSGVQADNIELITILLKYKADVNFPDYTAPIFCAIKNQSLKMVELLVEHGADLHNNGIHWKASESKYLPVSFAIEIGHLKIIECLTEKSKIELIGAELTPEVVKATKSNNWAIVELLLKRVNINYVNLPRIIRHNKLTNEKKLETVKTLVEKYKINVNSAKKTDDFFPLKSTPLMAATLSNNLDIFEFLIKNKADINDSENEYLVDLAIEKKSFKIINYLLQHKKLYKKETEKIEKSNQYRHNINEETEFVFL